MYSHRLTSLRTPLDCLCDPRKKKPCGSVNGDVSKEASSRSSMMVSGRYEISYVACTRSHKNACVALLRVQSCIKFRITNCWDFGKTSKEMGFDHHFRRSFMLKFLESLRGAVNSKLSRTSFFDTLVGRKYHLLINNQRAGSFC